MRLDGPEATRAARVRRPAPGTSDGGPRRSGFNDDRPGRAAPSRVGLRPSIHSIRRGFLASALVIAISYASPVRSSCNPGTPFAPAYAPAELRVNLAEADRVRDSAPAARPSGTALPRTTHSTLT